MIFDKKEFPNLHLLNSLNNTKGSRDIHRRFCHFGAACLISSGIINPLHIATSDLSVMAIYD
jgi:hypothetical protein